MQNMIFDIPGQPRLTIPKTNGPAIRQAMEAQRKAIQAQNQWNHSDAAYEFIKRHEKYRPYPYLDTRGNVTIGVGTMVPDESVMIDTPLVDLLGNPVSRKQRGQVFRDIKALWQQEKYRNLQAEYFPNPHKVTLPESEADRIARKYIEEELPHIKNKFQGFDTLPDAAKTAIIDMQYNLGDAGFQRTVPEGSNKTPWPNFYSAIDARDFETAAREASRKGIGLGRNQETQQLLIDAAKEWQQQQSQKPVAPTPEAQEKGGLLSFF